MLWRELALVSVPASSRLKISRAFIFPSEQYGISGLLRRAERLLPRLLDRRPLGARRYEITRPLFYRCEDESINYRRNCPITFEGSTGMRRRAAACCRQVGWY